MMPTITYQTKVPQIHIDHIQGTVHAFNTEYFDFVLDPSFERHFYNVQEWRSVCDEASKLSQKLRYELSYMFFDSKENLTHRGWRAKPSDTVLVKPKQSWFKKLFA